MKAAAQTASPVISPEAFKIADPALLAALIEQQEAGLAKPGYADLARTLDRDKANVRRSAILLAEAGLISLEPFTVYGHGRAIAAIWRGEASERRSPGPIYNFPAMQIDGPPAAQPSSEQAIAHCDIHASPLNPRKSFDADELDKLADDIVANGLLQNIVLRPWAGEPGHYEIAAGERRWRAVGRLIEQGKAEPDYPMRALVREMTDRELLLIALSENANRVDPPPMEEAAGLLAFRQMRATEIAPVADARSEDWRRACGEANREAAEAMGKTTRWVEIRLKLVTDLAAPLQTALAEGQISLAQARAICTAPAERQINALEPMIKGWGGWDTADGIRDQLRRRGLPVSEAGFDPALYDGETMEDPETGEIIMLDTGLITSLQMAAMKQRRKALQAEGAAFVEIVERFDYNKFDHVYETTPKQPVGYLLQIAELRIKETRVTRTGTKPAAAKPATDGEPEPETAQPYSQRHWLQADIDRSRRLRTAIAHAGPKPALAIAIIALLPRGLECNIEGPREWLKGHHSRSNDKAIANPPEIAARLTELVGSAAADSPDCPFGIKRTAVVVRDPVGAFALLAAADIVTLNDLHAAVIAAQCALWPDFNPGKGDPFTTALAAHLAPHLPAFEMTADYLAPFTQAQRRQIARASGIGEAASEMPAKAADAIAWIVGHPDRNPAWCPPEMALLPHSQVEQNVSALLAAAPAPDQPGEPA